MKSISGTMLREAATRVLPSGTRGLRTHRIALALGVAAAVAFTASAADPTHGRHSLVPARVRQWLQVGDASWYGLKFQGHKTATGERYDMHSLTCAHRSLPLGSWLRVTNLRNQKSILVRVNDRGPMTGSRVVDLSYAAARAVGLNGTGRVKLEAVSAADPGIARELVAQTPAAQTPAAQMAAAQSPLGGVAALLRGTVSP